MRSQKQRGAGIELPVDPGVHALFFDLDGTLAELADTPDRARVDAGTLVAVRRLHAAAGGALALISGRTVADVDRLVAPLRLPVAGQHGAERRDAAGMTHCHAGGVRRLAALRPGVLAWAAAFPDLVVEDKGMSLAIHYRQAPRLAGEVRRALDRFLERAGDALRVQEGKMVLELRPAGKDKGTAILEFMREVPFRGRSPVFVGDDATDEYGFAVVNGLGGQSVKVGSGASVARCRLSDVMAVRRWLEALLDRSARQEKNT